MFAAFFILILVFNWSGLIPVVGPRRGPARAHQRRQRDHRPGAGRVLHVPRRGLPATGLRGLPAGKFFPLYEFKQGIGAGLIALFVGLVELMLEFVKPLTLSMRLFGNIYGGEVALGVVTALTVAVLPVALLRPRVHAQLRPGAHLQHPHADVHHRRRSSPTTTRRERWAHEGMDAVHDATHPVPAAATSAAVHSRPQAPGAARNHPKEGTSTWNTSVQAWPPLGVIGPGIGIGILGGMAAGAIGRNPDAAGQIRGLAIILAAFAEGLGVLAVVVGLLAIFIQPA